MKETTKTTKQMMKVLISTQRFEWYGDDEFVGDLSKGRYKPKWGRDFVVEVEESMALYGEERILEAFNKEHNKPNAYDRYEALGIEPYSEPIEVTLNL